MRRLNGSLLLAALVWGCSQQVTQSPDSMGGGTQTVGIVGRVVDTTGAGVPAALVKLRRSDYLDTGSVGLSKADVFLANVQTDTAGAFSLLNVDTGAYAIEILSSDRGAAVACTVANSGARIVLPPMVLRPTATIRGMVPRSAQFDSTRMQVCLFGFDHSATTNLNGEFALNNVPAGNYTLRFVARMSAYGAYDTVGVSAQPGEVHDLGPVAFPQRTLGIDSADSAAAAAILDSNGLASIDLREVTAVDPLSRRIIALNLARYGVKRIPAIIGTLTALTRLILEDDSIESLPPEIGKLVHLSELNVGDNQLTAIPAEIGSCESLYSLVATGNRLTSLPDSLGKLQNLHYIMVEDNQIAGLPRSLTGWFPDFLSVSFDFNLLCTIGADQQSWLDRYSYDKNWRDSQTCK